MQPATYWKVTGHEFERPDSPPKESPVPTNAAEAELPRWIQQHSSQVDQWCQMANTENILKQQLLDFLDEKYFKDKRQVHRNHANHTLTGIIQHMYDDHGTISPMEIGESEKKWSKNGLS